MTNSDLSDMSIEQLQDVVREAMALANSKRAEVLKNLIAKWTNEVVAEGFNLDDAIEIMTENRPKGSAKKAIAPKAPFRYVNKNNLSEGYSGRGPYPKWLKDELADGTKALKDFAI